nr:conjugative transfer protein MobI(A/C) [Edwardsiella piscicida]
MGLPKEKCLELLKVDRAKERGSLLKEDFDTAHSKFVSDIQSACDREFAVLALEAQLEADSYWDMHREARAEARGNEQGRVGTRVRIIGVSLSLEWYYNRFFDAVLGQKKKVLSTYISKGPGTSHSMSHFKKEPQWAQELIEHVESRYTPIRQRAAALSKIRKAVREYERLTAQSYNKNVPNEQE